MRNLFLFLTIFLILFSCTKKNQTNNNNIENIQIQDAKIEDKEVIYQSEDENYLSEEELKTFLDKMANTELNIKSKNIKIPKYNVNKDYLKDNLVFSSLNTSRWNKKNIACVGTKDVKLYKDIEGTEEICGIPKGTIIEIKEELKKLHETDEIDDLDYFYKFNNEYNNWYKVIFENKTGYVFGSYLVNEESINNIITDYSGIQRQNIDDYVKLLARVSYFYTRNDKQDEFYDFNGAVSINDNVKKSLIEKKFILEKVNTNEYSLDLENPDDMIALYKNLNSDRMATPFITTDILIHTLHLLFDRMLKSTETRIFYPILKKMINDYYNEIIKLESNISPDEVEYKKTVEITKNYFIIISDLLDMKLMDKEQYPESVKKEIDLINNAQGFEKSPNFDYVEDYSQFKPRGHYTQTEELKKYFKAMMFMGRIHFYCVSKRKNPEIIKKSIILTKCSLLMTKIAVINKDIFNSWKALFKPISYLIGESDDYTLEQFIGISKDVDFNNFGKWINNEENIIKFMQKANKELKPPKISGNSLLMNSDMVDNLTENNPPGGFRLMGQRFVFDSYITNMLSTPRVGDVLHPRNMAKGFDVMGVFGNKIADAMLSNDKENIPDYTKNYNNLIKEINKWTDDDWRSTFYNSYLKIIKGITTFDSSNSFYFTQHKDWEKKSLLTSFGSWAELRHDTILYVKQSYGEKSGKGPEKTWVLDDIKRPVAYVEPNLEAMYWLQTTIKDGIELLSENGFMSENFKLAFQEFNYMIDILTVIAEKEANNKNISEQENEYIYKIPFKLTKIILPYSDLGFIEQSDLQMALVADVHTDSFNAEVLEVATGIPYRIYVALNDGQGGKRIAEGYTYSYYEFHQPMNDRLNDEQWKEKVYGNDINYLEERKPSWIKDILVK